MKDKTFIFDFSVDAWITNLDIEAETYEEALEKLNNMSLRQIINDGNVKDFNISNVDYEVNDSDDGFDDYDEDSDYDQDLDYDDYDEDSDDLTLDID